jgi:hypothetical protein
VAHRVPGLLPVDDELSPRSTAEVRSGEVRPCAGLDIPCDQISSLLSIGLRKRSCSSVPKCMIAAMLATPITLTGPGARARLISSR